MALPIQYQPFRYQETALPFDLVPMAAASTQRSQQRYDTTNQAISALNRELDESDTYDPETKNIVLGKIKNQIDELDQRYNGDLSAGMNDYIQLIGKAKSDPYWNLAKKQIENVKALNELKDRFGSDLLIANDPSQKRLINPETGQYINPSELSPITLRRSELEKDPLLRAQQLSKVVNERLASSDVPGYFKKVISVGLHPKEVEQRFGVQSDNNEGYQIASQQLATTPTLDKYLENQGITDPKDKVKWIQSFNYDVLKNNLGYQEQDKYLDDKAYLLRLKQQQGSSNIPDYTKLVTPKPINRIKEKSSITSKELEKSINDLLATPNRTPEQEYQLQSLQEKKNEIFNQVATENNLDKKTFSQIIADSFQGRYDKQDELAHDLTILAPDLLKVSNKVGIDKVLSDHKLYDKYPELFTTFPSGKKVVKDYVADMIDTYKNSVKDFTKQRNKLADVAMDNTIDIPVYGPRVGYEDKAYDLAKNINLGMQIYMYDDKMNIVKDTKKSIYSDNQGKIKAATLVANDKDGLPIMQLIVAQPNNKPDKKMYAALPATDDNGENIKDIAFSQGAPEIYANFVYRNVFVPKDKSVNIGTSNLMVTKLTKSSKGYNDIYNRVSMINGIDVQPNQPLYVLTDKDGNYYKDQEGLPVIGSNKASILDQGYNLAGYNNSVGRQFTNYQIAKMTQAQQAKVDAGKVDVEFQ